MTPSASAMRQWAQFWHGCLSMACAAGTNSRPWPSAVWRRCSDLPAQQQQSTVPVGAAALRPAPRSTGSDSLVPESRPPACRRDPSQRLASAACQPVQPLSSGLIAIFRPRDAQRGFRRPEPPRLGRSGTQPVPTFPATRKPDSSHAARGGSDRVSEFLFVDAGWKGSGPPDPSSEPGTDPSRLPRWRLRARKSYPRSRCRHEVARSAPPLPRRISSIASPAPSASPIRERPSQAMASEASNTSRST